MSWSVYSAEDFPKWDEENGCMCDYRQALGVQVILKAGQWTKLEDLYRHVRYESWIDAAGEGRESVVLGKEVALRLEGDFRTKGIACADLDKITDEERVGLEKKANEANLKMRRMFVDRFEQQFRTKMQGGPGRWLPNAYEAECYKILGLKPPDTVQKAPEERQPQVVIKESVDPELLAQLVAAEVARITAQAKR
jgi:hypothetical protein